jgi:sec-independent protein translocase protein TatA
MGNMGIWQLLIIAVIVILLFGTKKLRGLGSDLGGAIKGFKKAVSDEDAEKAALADKKQSKASAEEEVTTKKDQA